MFAFSSIQILSLDCRRETRRCLNTDQGGSKISTVLQAGLVWGKVLQVDGPLNVIVGGGAAIPVSRLLPSLSIVDAGSPPPPSYFPTPIQIISQPKSLLR